MVSILATQVFSIVGFIVGLVAVIILFGIIKRTKGAVRDGFIFVFVGIGAFVVFEAVKVLEVFLVLPQTIAADMFAVAFVVFLVIGMWKLKTLIRGLSDFGQAFVITSKDKYEDKLVSLVKDVRGICYVTLEEPYKNIINMLDLYRVDTSTMQFIDATGAKCEAENCIEVKNNPEDIKNTLERVLKEKNLSCVVVDNISAIKNIETFEIPLFVQNTASLIKANEAQGFFIGKMEKLGKQTINDITMLVDKVIGEG